MSNETTNTETKQPLAIFLDNIGRTLLGEVVPTENDPTILDIKNPVILHVVPDQQGRMSVQLLPIFFREFLADREEAAIFSFKKANITESKIMNLDFRLAAQYSQLFGNGNIFVPPSGTAPTQEASSPSKVVNLFEE